MNTTEKIQALYATARSSWNRCDWTHTHTDGNTCDCDGTDAESCDYAMRVVESAGFAEEYAKFAMEALSAGDFDAASDYAVVAQRYENQWGDTPVWGDWADAIANLAEDEAV